MLSMIAPPPVPDALDADADVPLGVPALEADEVALAEEDEEAAALGESRARLRRGS